MRYCNLFWFTSRRQMLLPVRIQTARQGQDLGCLEHYKWLNSYYYCDKQRIGTQAQILCHSPHPTNSDYFRIFQTISDCFRLFYAIFISISMQFQIIIAYFRLFIIISDYFLLFLTFSDQSLCTGFTITSPFSLYYFTKAARELESVHRIHCYLTLLFILFY